MAHRKVREVMTADVVTVGLDTRFKDLAGIMAEQKVSALPVPDAEGRLTGVVSEIDLLRKQEYQQDPTAKRAMSLDRSGQSRSRINKASRWLPDTGGESGTHDRRRLMSRHVPASADPARREVSR